MSFSSSPPRPPTIASFKKQLPEPELPSSRVRIYHPTRNTGFLFIPVRHCPLTGNVVSDKPCIPLTTVLDACQVLTGEKGVLARDDEGQQVLLSDLVDAGRYYYIVNGNPKEDYPIFHSFDDWVPPIREDVPDRWFTAVYPRVRPSDPVSSHPWSTVSGGHVNTLRSKAKEYDRVCKATGYETALDACHVVPTALGYWFAGRNIVLQLYYPYSIPQTLSTNDQVHDIRNLLTLRTDIHSRWHERAFTYIPVDGQLIAYYVSIVPERHATEFHCSQLDPPDRLDGYLMYIRFAYTVFACVPGEHDRIGRHPNSSRLMKPLPLSVKASPRVSQPSSLPTTAEHHTSAAAGGAIPSRTSGLNELDEFDLNAQMDDETAAKHIIEYFSDVDGPALPDDLAAAWAKYIPEEPELDMERLRSEWQDRQRQLREDGLQSHNAVHVM